MMLNRSGATSVIRTVCWMFLCSARFGVTDGQLFNFQWLAPGSLFLLFTYSSRR